MLALKTAFVDLVDDNEGLISVIDDVYAESIESVYDTSIRLDG